MRKGREALETAINLINSTKRWNAKVVYGDTDRFVVCAIFDLKDTLLVMIFCALIKEQRDTS